MSRARSPKQREFDARPLLTRKPQEARPIPVRLMALAIGAAVFGVSLLLWGW